MQKLGLKFCEAQALGVAELRDGYCLRGEE